MKQYTYLRVAEFSHIAIVVVVAVATTNYCSATIVFIIEIRAFFHSAYHQTVCLWRVNVYYCYLHGFCETQTVTCHYMLGLPMQPIAKIKTNSQL